MKKSIFLYLSLVILTFTFTGCLEVDLYNLGIETEEEFIEYMDENYDEVVYNVELDGSCIELSDSMIGGQEDKLGVGDVMEADLFKIELDSTPDYLLGPVVEVKRGEKRDKVTETLVPPITSDPGTYVGLSADQAVVVYGYALPDTDYTQWYFFIWENPDFSMPISHIKICFGEGTNTIEGENHAWRLDEEAITLPEP